MAQPIQIKRTLKPDNPPDPLLNGELSVELAEPIRLWVGTPTGNITLIDAARSISDEYLPKTGGAMVGPLSVFDPVEPRHAVTKRYVDTLLSSQKDQSETWQTTIKRYVDTAIERISSGLRIVGALVLEKSGKASVITGTANGIARWQLQLADSSQETGGNAGSNLAVVCYADNGERIIAPLIIVRATGAVLLAQDPKQPMQAATKQYVDERIAALEAALSKFDALRT